MAQGSHECGAGFEPVENIRYTAERACQVWPGRFGSAADCYRKVGSHAGDPQFPIKLIDSVYGNRMGNRPGTHDGSTFIGRGFSQTTGRDEYDRLGKMVGLDLVNHPELLIDPVHFLECGVANFILCGCLPCAKANDVLNVTRRLNGGTVGLSERTQWLAKWKAELGSTPVTLAPAATKVPVILPAAPRPLTPEIPKLGPAPSSSSITSPAKGSIGAFIASIFSALKRKA
jgi:putative chitinase